MRCPTFRLFQLLYSATLTYAAIGNWTKPNDQSPSFTDTYTVNERIIVSWVNLNNSVNDLWLTRYDTSTDAFALRLQVGRNISFSDSYEWTIAVDTTEVAKDTRFILQFLPTGAAYDPTQIPQLPSPAFNLIIVNQQSPPNGTIGAPSITPSSSTVTNSQSVISSSSLSSQQPSGQPPSGSSGPGFTKSVAIGVAIVAAVLVLGTVIGAYFVIRAYKRPQPIESINEEFKATGPYEVLGNSRQPTELSSKEAMVHEVNSSKESMAYDSDNSPVYEMSTTIKRPGLHEMPG